MCDVYLFFDEVPRACKTRSDFEGLGKRFQRQSSDVCAWPSGRLCDACPFTPGGPEVAEGVFCLHCLTRAAAPKSASPLPDLKAFPPGTCCAKRVMPRLVRAAAYEALRRKLPALPKMAPKPGRPQSMLYAFQALDDAVEAYHQVRRPCGSTASTRVEERASRRLRAHAEETPCARREDSDERRSFSAQVASRMGAAAGTIAELERFEGSEAPAAEAPPPPPRKTALQVFCRVAHGFGS